MYKKKSLLTLSILGLFVLCSCTRTPKEPTPIVPPPVTPTEPLIKTPAKRMPAEFEPVSMVKMCFPNNVPLNVYKEIAKDNKLLLLCNPDSDGRSRVGAAKSCMQEVNANMDNITFLSMNIDDD